MRARWEWRFDDEAGTTLDHPGSPVFDGRYEAEEWLGDRWRALSDQGVRSAQLLHEGEPVGPTVAVPAR